MEWKVFTNEMWHLPLNAPYQIDEGWFPKNRFRGKKVMYSVYLP